MSWLEDEADAYRTAEKERIDFQWRIRKVNSANIAEYKGITIIQPERESGVYSIVLQLLTVNSDVFPFQIIDYDTHSGIDVIVKGDKRTPIQNSKLFYVEFNAKQSMSRVGRCIDNGPMEGFWGILKSEMYYLLGYRNKT